MKTNASIIIPFAFVVGLLIVAASIIYTNQRNMAIAQTSNESLVVMDELGNEYIVDNDDQIFVTIVSDADCKACDTDELESWLTSQMGKPIAVRRLNFDEEAGKSVIEENNATFLPYIMIDKSVESLQNFTHLTHHVISKTKGGYYLDLQKTGKPIGRYLNVAYYKQDDPSAPHVVLEISDYEFGDVRLSGGKVETKFIVRNEGEQPLVFVNANTSCGCTSTQIKLDGNISPVYMMAGHQDPVSWQGSLDPGEEGEIIVYYDPAVHPDLEGEVTRTVTIDTNDPNMPQIKLKIYVNQIAN